MNKYWVLGLGLLLALTHWQMYEWGADSAKLSSTATTTQEKIVWVTKERTVEQAAQTAVDKVGTDVFLQQGDLLSSLAAANGTVDGLREQLDKANAKLGNQSNYSSVVAQRDAATKASLLFSELYQRSQGRLTELAGAYEDVRLTASGCISSYNQVRTTFNSGK